MGTYTEKCPVCDSNMEVRSYYLDSYILEEEYASCDVCKLYSYHNSYGSGGEFINRWRMHTSKNNEENVKLYEFAISVAKQLWEMKLSNLITTEEYEYDSEEEDTEKDDDFEIDF